MKIFLKSVHKGFKNFGENIIVIVNTVLLSIVYIIGVGITSIIAKISKKDFFETKHPKNSYWSDLNLKKKPMNHYYRQF